MQKLNGREIYTGILVLLITIIFISMQVRETFSGYSDSTIRSESGSLVVNTKDALYTVHVYALITIGLLGSILLFRKKRTGWIFSFSMLAFYLMLALYGLVMSLWMGMYGGSLIIIGTGVLALLLGLIFLLIPSTKEKFRVSKKTILPTLLLFMALVVITFFL